MRYLLIIAAAGAAAGLLEAQPVISNLQSDAITRTTARVGFKVTGNGNYYLQFGLTTGYGYRTPPMGGATNGVHVLTGLQPSTIYNWRVCNESFTPPAGCSANQTLTTLDDDQDTVATAVLPTLLDTAYPAITGSVLFVNADCSNFTAKLTEAAALDGNLNHEIRFALGTVCKDQIELPAKNGANASGGGYIILRPDVADNLLPPEGTRITRDWETNLPLFVNAGIGYSESGSNPATCHPVEYYWDTSQAGANKYKACLTPNTWTLVSATPGYTSGSGAPGTSCPVQGQYYFNTAGTPNRSLYRCVTLNSSREWIRLPPSGGGDDFALANYYGQPLRGYRFVGLRFQPGDMNGGIVAGLLGLGRGGGAMSNIVVDRCIFYTGGSASSQRAVGLDGAGSALVDSYIDLRVVPSAQPYNPVGNQFPIVISNGSGPFKVVNNYVRGVGLLLFVTDNSGIVPRDDFEIRRNTFTYNDAYRCGGPASDGICRDVRAPLEFKRGRRVWIDGNLFENYWSTVGTYPAIIVSPRASGSNGFDGNNYQIRDFTITNNVFRKGTGFLEVWAGDNQGYRNTWATERFTIRNNLIYEISGYASNFGGYNDGRGAILWHGGITDVIFENNTVYKNTGSGPAFLTLTDQRTYSGLRWRNNILWLSRGTIGGEIGLRYGPSAFPDGAAAGGSTATTKLNKTAMRAPTPMWEFRNNAIVATTTGDTAREQNRFPSGNFWPGDNTAGEAALQFTNAANGDFRLKPTSPYAAGGPRAGTDGADLGVDFTGLNQAAGVVTGVRVLKTGRTQAIIRYGAPDGAACGGVDVSTTATFTSLQRFADSGGGKDRTILATGLTPGTLYYYRVLCGSSKTTGTFTTTDATAVSSSMTLRLRPLSWSGVATASVSYGPTAALGTTSSAVVCGTECVVTIPVTLTQAVYWQANYFTSGQIQVGASRVEVSIP